MSTVVIASSRRHRIYRHFFENFDREKQILCEKLKINIEEKSNFNLEYTLKNLYKFKDNLSVDEISYIDKNLNEYY